MTYTSILYRCVDGIARLTLHRPDKLNAFTAQMHGEVRDALARLGPEGARVLVLTGSGRAFCAGQDLSDRAVAPGGAPVDLGESIARDYAPLVRTLRALPLPVLAAVNGVAAGAGANLALACDVVVAARSAVFVQGFNKLGLVPDCGGTWLLPRLVGNARALGLMLLGDQVSGEQAAAWGLIWQCVDDALLAETVDALAQRLAQEAIYSGWQHSLSEQLDVERDLQQELGRSADYAEGVAAFRDKRSAQFTGR